MKLISAPSESLDNYWQPAEVNLKNMLVCTFYRFRSPHTYLLKPFK